MAEVVYHTGMRADEVASISYADVLNQARGLDHRLTWQQFRLTVRAKGRPSRKVVVSSPILRALVMYYDVERRPAVVRAGELAETASRKFRDPTQLFVNGINASHRDLGRPVQAETASRAFTRAVLAEGLVVYREGFELDPESGEMRLDEDGEPVILALPASSYTLHDLRHTFAVSFYNSEIARGNPAPWEKLRVLLGHSNSETTRRIYLRHVDIEEAFITDSAHKYMRIGLSDG